MGYNYATMGAAKKSHHSSKKAKKRLLGAREHKESPEEYRDREDLLIPLSCLV